MEKRKLGFWEIWNMSFGFLGIQMGFALQNAKFPYLCSPFTKTKGYGDSWYRFGPASPGSIFKREKSKT